jgi:hypothetical protein
MNVLGTSSSPRGSAISQPVNQAFDSHPGRPACILLPIYDLLCSNTTFFNVLLSSQSFWESFLSFSSYLLSHASSNARSELYGRLVLVTLIHLAEEGARFICGASEDSFKVTVKFCRDVSDDRSIKQEKKREKKGVNLGEIDECMCYL